MRTDVASENQVGSDRSFSPAPILLVDDDSDCRMLIRDAIVASKLRNTVYEASNAHQAWALLHRQPPFENALRPGLIYLDVEMPGVSGIELLRKIRSDASLADISVVMMTGVSDEKQMWAAAEAGANSYAIKPASAGVSQNRNRLHQLLARRAPVPGASFIGKGVSAMNR